MENKLKKIMSELFDIEVSEINENSSPDNIEKWDSLNQMNLIQIRKNALAVAEKYSFENQRDFILKKVNIH